MNSVVSLVLNNFQNDSRVLKENISLLNAGYDVRVVALHERNLAEQELVEGVNVHRVKLISRNLPKTFIIQIIKYIEFLIYTIIKYRKSSIFHCNDLNTLPIGILIKILFNNNAKIIYDAHEYESEINGIGNLEKFSRYLLEKFLIRYANKIITVSDSIANEYATLYKIKKPDIVLNCPYLSNVQHQNRFRKEMKIRAEQTIFLYQGGLAKGRGIELLIEAFSKMDSDKNIIVFLGFGPLEGLIKEAMQHHANIFFHPAVSPKELIHFTSSADFGICFVEDSCLSYRYSLPNKLFEYIMAEIPVISSNLIEIKKLIERYKIGVAADTNNVVGLMDAIDLSLKLDYKQLVNNVCFIKQQFCWESQEKVLLEVYRE